MTGSGLRRLCITSIAIAISLAGWAAIIAGAAAVVKLVRG